MGRPLRALLSAALAWSAVALGGAGPVAAGAATDPVVITYEVRGRGNVSDLEVLAVEAAAVYADPRGWNLGGSLRFERVPSGGDFTLWLAADDRMATFGGACDRVWSCRNGRHVVINENRWLGSSDSWLAAGAPLSTYRQMVLNHETGHWLGFGHAGCSRAGAAAPVMQQQSMTLAGCVPNPWPLVSEQAALAARRGVRLVQRSATVDPPRPGPPPPPPAVSQGPESACLRLPKAALRPWIPCF